MINSPIELTNTFFSKKTNTLSCLYIQKTDTRSTELNSITVTNRNPNRLINLSIQDNFDQL